MTQARINQYFSEREGELISTLAKLIAVRSVREQALPGMPFGEGPAEALALGLEIAVEAGFKTRNFENYVGTADINDQETMLAILCHLDVVGEGSGWSTPPYAASIRDGMLYGRGASDDKGPTVATLFAMKAVKDLAIPLKYNVRLILGTDEETACSDIEYYFKREPAPPCTFAPDGTFPVVNTEKGGLRPTFSKSWAVSEALPRLLEVKGGDRINVVPGQAVALVEGLASAEIQAVCDQAAEWTGAEYSVTQENETVVKILVIGKAEHASRPEKGCNAVTALSTVLAALPFAESDGFDTIKALNQMFPHGDYWGQAAGVAQSDQISGPLTLSFNMYEHTLNGCTGRFDCRTPLCVTKENCEDVIIARFNSFGVQMDGKLSRPHHTPGDSHFVKTLLAAYKQYTGNQGGCKASGGGSYVHGIEGGVCFGASMPGFASNVHGVDERVCLKDLITAAKIYTQVIIDLCA